MEILFAIVSHRRFYPVGQPQGIAPTVGRIPQKNHYQSQTSRRKINLERKSPSRK